MCIQACSGAGLESGGGVYSSMQWGRFGGGVFQYAIWQRRGVKQAVNPTEMHPCFIFIHVYAIQRMLSIRCHTGFKALNTGPRQATATIIVDNYFLF